MQNYSPKIKRFEFSIAILTSQISVFILICHNLPKAIQKARKKHSYLPPGGRCKKNGRMETQEHRQASLKVAPGFGLITQSSINSVWSAVL